MSSFDTAKAVRASARNTHRNFLNLKTSAAAISTALAIAAFPASVMAQAQPSSGAATTEEIVVTGSRIVREGYEAPTPLTVVGAEALANSASPNLLSYLSDLPALSGAQLTTSGQTFTTTASAGAQSVNLRSLGSNRTLVLLDGKRVVGVDYNGAVNVGSFPQQLIERVDIVTGGASAVYGSDAVAGVANFILDKDFTGVKGEVSGGITNYGDDLNYKIDLTGGFAFAGGRGHVLLSAGHLFKEGIDGDGGRKWNRRGTAQFANPNYTPTNGQPSLLVLEKSAPGTATDGGLITSGPLKGLAFGAGGATYNFNYGSIISSPFMVGGDWLDTDIRDNYWLDTRQEDYNVFTRFSYDITDNVNAYVQYDWAQGFSFNDVNQYWMFGGPGQTITIDNAFLPASVRTAMVAQGLTSFQMGTLNKDVGAFGPNNLWISHRVYTGFEGSFDAFGTSWNWDVSYGYGSTKQYAHSDLHAEGVPAGYGLVTSLYRQSIDAVFDANGKIVCRVALTNPASTCKPWNPMGIGVNEGRVPSFITPNYQYGLVELTSYQGSISGEPFSVPAGPVSLALSFEHRKQEIHSVVDPDAERFDRPTGNHSALDGASSVTEGAVEAIIPLAKGESWAQDWDLSLAARATDYKLSGYVTTWKVGTTYSPTDEFRFRLTRSRDIRAPDLQELFAKPNPIGAGLIIDRFRNDAQYATQGTLRDSNRNLQPEKADTTGIGLVYSPAWFEGFTSSIDYWDVNLKGAVYVPTAQQVMDLCADGSFTALCPSIARDPATGLVTRVTFFPINLAAQKTSGLDIEASYRVPVSNFISDFEGGLTLRGLATVYLRNWQDNTFSAPVDHVGENIPKYPNSSPPFWKLTVSATYTLDPMSITLTGRGVSAGYNDRSYIECTTGCPTSTGANPTINNNRVPGAFYLDANVTYDLNFTETAETEMFFSVKNILNRDPPFTGGSFLSSETGQGALYDVLGTVFRAGVRFKM